MPHPKEVDIYNLMNSIEKKSFDAQARWDELKDTLYKRITAKTSNLAPCGWCSTNERPVYFCRHIPNGFPYGIKRIRSG